ncbi:uncharacterized protein METZ01_LOCUS281077, partial [marine metagenome]
VLLILIQLPKKESGSGLAFGGGTLDMALGAGAGNVLTKLTKVSASLFLLLCLVLAIIGNPGKSDISKRIGAQAQPATIPATAPATTPTGTPDAAPVQAEVTDKVDDALAGAADTPAPTTPEAATPAATPGKPAETPAAPPEGGEKK